MAKMCLIQDTQQEKNVGQDLILITGNGLEGETGLLHIKMEPE